MTETRAVGFEEASRIEGRDGVYEAYVPDGWQQGRGAFGGLVAGLLVRAIEAEAGEPERAIRALNAEIPSPVLVGPTRLEVRTLRRGSGVSSLEAHLVQEGEVRARASAVLGKPRPVDLALSPEPPPMPDTEPAAVDAARLPPSFARHFTMRPLGPRPFSGADEAVVTGWVSFAEAPRAVGAAELAALIDAYYPAFFPVLDEPRPGGTVSFPLHLTPAARAVSPGEPLFYRARALFAGEGFVYEQRELWTRDGRLVALNPQTFAVIR